MDELYYEMIFKRKSFHRFSGKNRLSNNEVKEIEAHIQTLKPLIEDIATAFRIVPHGKTSCKRGEYCILIYSETKEHYLHNVGYMAQQLDLWLASKNIGACWYGMGKTQEPVYHGLNFVIMIAVGKEEENEFRRDYTKTRRKAWDEIWKGSEYQEIASAVRYAPSACNTQPWLVKCEAQNLFVYQVKGKRGIMPRDKVAYYNKIDMGIFMLFLELCLRHEKIAFDRTLYSEGQMKEEALLTAVYRINRKEMKS